MAVCIASGTSQERHRRATSRERKVSLHQALRRQAYLGMVWDIPVLVDHTVEAGLQALQWGDAKATLTSP